MNVNSCNEWIDECFKRAMCRQEQAPEYEGENIPEVRRVIWNKNACIVMWADGTKTVVKCQEGDQWNNEVGLMAAFSKKLFGNDNTFNKVINRYCSVFFNEDERIQKGLEKMHERFSQAFEGHNTLTKATYLHGRYQVYMMNYFGFRRELPYYVYEFIRLANKHFKTDMETCNVELSVVETKDNTFKVVLVEKKGEVDEVQE
jgi:hypothetical protein